jgi:hypothetical protein
MADLELGGTLDCSGMLTLQGSAGGKVRAGGKEVLVEQVQGTAPIVVIPPPPASPLYSGTDVVVVSSLNRTVKAGARAVVTQGMVLQGPWPGFVMRGAGTVTVNQIPMNVVGEQATIFPSGAVAQFDASGQ